MDGSQIMSFMESLTVAAIALSIVFIVLFCLFLLIRLFSTVLVAASGSQNTDKSTQQGGTAAR